MKAYVTSIGETTTDLSVWSLERLGLEVELVRDKQTTLWEKLRYIFSKENDDFIRVDADVIVNKNVLELTQQTDLWWYQAYTYDWFKQDITHGGVQFIRKECLDIVRHGIPDAKDQERPESYLYRLPELHNPRRCGTFEKVCGLNGYGQSDDDWQRVAATKRRRGHHDDYDWELAQVIESTL